MDDTPAFMPWYKSKVLRGVALIVVSRIVARFHIVLPNGVNIDDIVDTAMDVATLAGAMYAAYARVAHPLPELTITKAKADAKNATPAPVFFSNNPPESKI